MDIHKNARLTPHSRAELVRRVIAREQSPGAVAAAFGISEVGSGAGESMMLRVKRAIFVIVRLNSG